MPEVVAEIEAMVVWLLENGDAGLQLCKDVLTDPSSWSSVRDSGDREHDGNLYTVAETRRHILDAYILC